MAKRTTDKRRVTVQNVNVPGHTVRLDATKYEAMKKAMLAVLPTKPPGAKVKRRATTGHTQPSAAT